MPSAQNITDAALLANAAYDANPLKNPGNGWEVLSFVRLGMSQAEWDNDPSDPDNSPFLFDNLSAQGIVAFNSTSNSLAIAFRGTDPSDGISDFLTDIAGPFGAFNSHYALFSNLISKLHAFASANGISNILVAGHSLGGAMAEIFMQQHSDTVGMQYVGVTFGSPGSPNFVHSFHDSRILNIGQSGDPVFGVRIFHVFRAG